MSYDLVIFGVLTNNSNFDRLLDVVDCMRF